PPWSMLMPRGSIVISALPDRPAPFFEAASLSFLLAPFPAASAGAGVVSLPDLPAGSVSTACAASAVRTGDGVIAIDTARPAAKAVHSTRRRAVPETR